MNMELQIIIHSLEVDISAQAREDNIRAFVIWIFKTNVGDIKIKGGTIRRKEFGSKSLLSYEPPSIKGRQGKYNRTFFMDDKQLYLKLCAYTIKRYCEESGESGQDFSHYEEVNPDDIPF